MDAPFPFGFPLPTAWYLVLYVVTLVIHVLFMNYVLAGTGWLAISRLLGPIDDQRQPIQSILRDWMPFFLSAAITAGVAPLLFIQILYKQSFYTANLLLFHRWMAILPVLIVGFYLLYLLKTKRVSNRAPWLQRTIGLAAFLCFAFIAYSWTENHLLSIKNTAAWGEFYAQQRLKHFEAALIPRLGIWFIGSIPTMLVMVLWQVWFQQNRQQDRPHPWPDEAIRRQARQSAIGALIGLGGAGLAAVTYMSVAWEEVSGAAFSFMAAPFALLAAVGLVVQVVGWTRLGKTAELSAKGLGILSVGVSLTVIGMTVVREAIRLQSLNITPLFDQHADAAQIGGLSVFLLFFVINGLLVAWVFALVKQGLADKQKPELEA